MEAYCKGGQGPPQAVAPLKKKTKELGWKETKGSQNIGIEGPQGNRIVDQRKVLKIWENYVMNDKTYQIQNFL